MRRRDFLSLIGSGIAASWSSSARAQQTAKVYRIAIVSPSTPASEINETHSIYTQEFEALAPHFEPGVD